MDVCYRDSFMEVDLGRLRHNAKIIREQLAKIKEQSIMVGDRRHDIIGANTCMIESIGVRFGYAEADELEEAGADYIVETVEELGQLLNN